jgi:hypothetical protein
MNNILADIPAQLPAELLAFIDNGQNCANWRYKCLKMLNLSDNYIYRLSNLPWPFRNRYTVMKSITHFDKQKNCKCYREVYQ